MELSMELSIENVLSTHDGPYACYDTVVTAREIASLHKTGFLKIEYNQQRGFKAIPKKLALHKDKIDQWAEHLTAGDAYLGQLSWNFRQEERRLDYDPETRVLKISGVATLPDSYHRHKAILKAVESAGHGSGFDQETRVSIRIYNVPTTEESRIFYDMNPQYIRVYSGKYSRKSPGSPARIPKSHVHS